MSSSSDNSSAVKRWPNQPDRPSLRFREPFTVDVVARHLARTILRPELVFAWPALLYSFDRRYAHRLFALAREGQFPRLLSLATLRGLLRAYPLFALAWLFGLIRVLNAALERYASNLGEWKADKPNWSKEVVVVTGGARGIGAKIVELLSHEKRARVAVLDLGEPEYASAPRGAPAIHYYKVSRRRDQSSGNHAEYFFSAPLARRSTSLMPLLWLARPPRSAATWALSQC